MGASGWLVITRQLGSLADSLGNAKREVFAAGDFQDTLGIVADADAVLATLDNIDLPPGLDPTDQNDYLEFLRAERARQRAAILRYQAAQNIDDRIEALRTAVGFDGTHSAIDIPSVDALSPVATVNLIAHFATELPTIAAVRAHGHELEYLVIDRFTGIWFEVRDENGAKFIAIVGVSGD